MIWSILVAGIPERFHAVQPLLYDLLETQAVSRMPEVELLYLLDSRRRTVGAKRNALLDAARGEYVTFIDDDDRVAPDYVSRIYKALVAGRQGEQPVDVACFRQHAHLKDHGVIHDCTYSLAHYKQRAPEARRQLAPAVGPDGKPLGNVLAWTGPPAHTMAWRRGLIADTRFSEVMFGEDTAWVDALCEKAQSEVQLGGDALYHYQFSEQGSATRG